MYTVIYHEINFTLIMAVIYLNIIVIFIFAITSFNCNNNFTLHVYISEMISSSVTGITNELLLCKSLHAASV